MSRMHAAIYVKDIDGPDVFCIDFWDTIDVPDELEAYMGPLKEIVEFKVHCPWGFDIEDQITNEIEKRIKESKSE